MKDWPHQSILFQNLFSKSKCIRAVVPLAIMIFITHDPSKKSTSPKVKILNRGSQGFHIVVTFNNLMASKSEVWQRARGWWFESRLRIKGPDSAQKEVGIVGGGGGFDSNPDRLNREAQ